MKTSPFSVSMRKWLLLVALIGTELAVINPLRPMSRGRAIQIASDHASEVYRGIDPGQYSISAPSRPDWFEEWEVQFDHKSSTFGFLIGVEGGDIYNGRKVSVYVDNEWGKRP
jgi:hypothetical protein